MLHDPAPGVHVEQLGDSSVVLELRVWTDVGSYWDLLFDLRERSKLELDAAGLSIPFPQQDVYVKSLPADMDSRKPISGESAKPH